MSFIGPRPIVEDEITKYGIDFNLYKTVKPGISGLWQVSGRNNTTYKERVNLDVFYIENQSLWFDVSCRRMSQPKSSSYLYERRKEGCLSEGCLSVS